MSIGVDHEENIVEVRNVSFGYGGSEVLKDINLNIHRGDYLGLVGGNGAGKTTLIKIILGLIRPVSGDINLFGREIKDFKEWSKIGYVAQKATSFDANFPATVLEVVLMGRYGGRGLFRRIISEDYGKAETALRHVDMWDSRDRLIGDISGGEQQRVFIARALAGEPEIIFLDEPTVGVEKKIKDEFYALIRKLNKDLHLTVVLVTHDMENIANEAMHIVCLDCTVFFHETVEGFLNETSIATHRH